MKFKFSTVSVERLMNSPKYDDKEKGWIGCDLDGTLAKYDGWKGWDHIGDPIPKMVDRIKAYMSRGITVKIWTARASEVSLARNNLSFEQMEKVIQDWTEKHLGKRLEVVTQKDCFMLLCFDDSVVQVEQNTGNIIGSEIMLDFGEDADFNHPIKEYDTADLTGGLEWNTVDLDSELVNDFVSGLTKGGFSKVDIESGGTGAGFKTKLTCTRDDAIVVILLNTLVSSLKNEDETAWLSVDIAVANGTNRMIFKLDNLSMKSLGKYIADRCINKTSVK